MVSVELVIGLLTFWVLPLAVVWKDYEWYKTILKHHYKYHRENISSSYREKKRSSWLNCCFCGCCGKKPPNISEGWLIVISGILSGGALWGMYYYFIGNCQFNKGRMFVEDDQLGGHNYDRGAIVLTLLTLIWALFIFWGISLLKWRVPALATLSGVITTILNCVMLWAIGTTELCVRDDWTNRYWVTFALWLVYSIWWLLLTIISIIWWSIIGWRMTKGNEIKSAAKSTKSDAKEGKYFARRANDWNVHYAHASNMNNSHHSNQLQQQQQQSQPQQSYDLLRNEYPPPPPYSPQQTSFILPSVNFGSLSNPNGGQYQ